MSYLKLNRLQVIKEGTPVFNEEFHNGINIIRGHNSTGKSTISNFIFFALHIPEHPHPLLDKILSVLN